MTFVMWELLDRIFFSTILKERHGWMITENDTDVYDNRIFSWPNKWRYEKCGSNKTIPLDPWDSKSSAQENRILFWNNDRNWPPKCCCNISLDFIYFRFSGESILLSTKTNTDHLETKRRNLTRDLRTTYGNVWTIQFHWESRIVPLSPRWTHDLWFIINV